MRSYDYIANSSEDKHEEINSCLSNKCTYLTVLVIQTNFILFVYNIQFKKIRFLKSGMVSLICKL